MRILCFSLMSNISLFMLNKIFTKNWRTFECWDNHYQHWITGSSLLYSQLHGSEDNSVFFGQRLVSIWMFVHLVRFVSWFLYFVCFDVSCFTVCSVCILWVWSVFIHLFLHSKGLNPRLMVYNQWPEKWSARSGLQFRPYMETAN